MERTCSMKRCWFTTQSCPARRPCHVVDDAVRIPVTRLWSVRVTLLDYALLVLLTSVSLRVGQTLKLGLACDLSTEGTDLSTGGLPHEL